MEVGHMINGKLETSITGDKLFRLYRIFREGFMDAKIPIYKPIGFYLNDLQDSYSTTAIRRNNKCLNNPIEISKNLQKLIFAGEPAHIISTKPLEGRIIGANLGIKSFADSVRVIDKSVYLFTMVEAMPISLFCHENTGFKTIEENVEIMSNIKYNLGVTTQQFDIEKFYPLNSEHTLIDIIRILPFDGEEIRYKLKDGVAEEDIDQIFQKYMSKKGAF